MPGRVKLMPPASTSRVGNTTGSVIMIGPCPVAMKASSDFVPYFLPAMVGFQHRHWLSRMVSFEVGKMI